MPQGTLAWYKTLVCPKSVVKILLMTSRESGGTPCVGVSPHNHQEAKKIKVLLILVICHAASTLVTAIIKDSLGKKLHEKELKVKKKSLC